MVTCVLGNWYESGAQPMQWQSTAGREWALPCCRAGGAGPAADLAAAGQMAAAQRPAAGWASEFQRMRLDEQPAAQ